VFIASMLLVAVSLAMAEHIDELGTYPPSSTSIIVNSSSQPGNRRYQASTLVPHSDELDQTLGEVNFR